MAATTAAVIGAVGAVGSAAASMKAANAAGKAAKGMSVEFGSGSFSGPGGMGAWYGRNNPFEQPQQFTDFQSLYGGQGGSPYSQTQNPWAMYAPPSGGGGPDGVIMNASAQPAGQPAMTTQDLWKQAEAQAAEQGIKDPRKIFAELQAANPGVQGAAMNYNAQIPGYGTPYTGYGQQQGKIFETNPLTGGADGTPTQGGGLGGQLGDMMEDDPDAITRLRQAWEAGQNKKAMSGQAGMQLGDLEASRGGLVRLGEQGIGLAGMNILGQLPPEQQMQMMNLMGASGIGNITGPQALYAQQAQLAGLQGQAGAMGQNAFQQAMNQGEFGAGMTQQSMEAASGALGRLQTGYGDVQQQQLDLMRQQAQPFEQRQIAGELEAQFGRGIQNATAGERRQEALAKGLGEADLSRQMAAFDRADAVRQQDMSTYAQALGGAQSTRGLADTLLSGAFNRWGQTQELGAGLAGQQAGLQNQMYNQSYGLNDLNFQRQMGLLGQMQQNTLFGRGIRDADLAFGQQALAGQQGLFNQGLAGFNAALALGQARANAAIGAGSNTAAMYANYNPGAKYDAIAGMANAFGNVLNTYNQNQQTPLTPTNSGTGQ